MAKVLLNCKPVFQLRNYITPKKNFSISASLNVRVPDELMPVNLIEKYSSASQQPKGTPYDNKPFRIVLEANKKYAWCTCGSSKTQPLCDGSHKLQYLNIQLKPIFVMVDETKEYWLCNCKQSDRRPFCDGTHESEEVQQKFKKASKPDSQK